MEEFLARLEGLIDYEGIRPTSVNERSLVGETPLHFAARWGDIKVGEILLQIGADPNAHGEYGNTPLLEALYRRHYGFIKLLLSHGASKELKNDDGESPMDLLKLENDPKLNDLFQ